MSEPNINLAEQALDNLVNQFARPLDFLRELVQNSIDAGSPRIEVRIEFDPPKPGSSLGITRIHVDDWGEGMDQAVIDNKLTRLFESNKEGDLTKIGKFGIGFTSIFAIRPEAVLLETGKHGENWEVLFHKDRSFELRPMDRPIDGTKITLFKRMDREELEKFVEEARFILTYWCEHSNVPVTFWDRTRGESVEAVDSDDPFAAFEVDQAAASGPEQVNHPLHAETDVSVRIQRDDTEAVVGIANQPLYGYYNGGLTLLRTGNVDALGRFAPKLQRLAFKVKNDALEHTLTRDNVLQDDHWERVMEIVLEGRTKLVQALIANCVKAVEAGQDPEIWQQHLSVLCEEEDVKSMVLKSAHQPLFRSGVGEPLTLNAATASSGRLGIGPILMATDDATLTEGLAKVGVQLVDDTPGSRALLEATESPGLFQFLSSGRVLLPADEVFVRPQVIEIDELDAEERKLVKNVEELIRRAAGSSVALRVGDFGGAAAGSTEALCLNGPYDGGVFQRPGDGRWRWLRSFLLTRCMLINRHHPLFRSQMLAATESPWLAAAGLASALLAVEDIEGERTHRTLLQLASARFATEAAQ